MRYGLVAVLCTCCFILHAQQDSSIAKFLTPANEFRPARVYWVTGTEALLAAGSLIALNELWYKDYPRTNFHVFNDNHEWLLMDKTGHVITAYTTGRYGMKLLQWAGVKKNKAIWYGGLTGFVYLAGIEMLDAYSSAWGFSTGDMIANAAGSALLIGQEVLWQEQRIVPKFGFRRSGYAKYRPELLGSHFMEQVIKDYNGQTYWLSFNIASFLHEENSFPAWLNIAFGYGANGMVGGHENPPLTNAAGNSITFTRYRQFYISPDIDLTKLKVKSPLLKFVFGTFGFLKIPAPGIAIGNGKFSGCVFCF